MKRLFVGGKIKIQLLWLNNRHPTDLKNQINRAVVCDDRFNAKQANMAGLTMLLLKLMFGSMDRYRRLHGQYQRD